MSEHNQQALRAHILELSESRLWPVAVKEWELFGIEKSDEWGSCPCGQAIKEHCFLRNRQNDNVTHVGNVCVNRFMAIETDGLFDGLRRIIKDPNARPNPALIQYAANAGFLFGEGEVAFLASIVRKRHLSQKQAAWVEKINRRILAKTVVRRVSALQAEGAQ